MKNTRIRHQHDILCRACEPCAMAIGSSRRIVADKVIYLRDPKKDGGESKYRIKKGNASRAISGISMGGYGALHFAFAHPELFSAACPLSAATGPLTIEEAKTVYAQYLDNPQRAI